MDYIFYILEKEWDKNVVPFYKADTEPALGFYAHSEARAYTDGKLAEIENIYTTLKDLIK